MLTDCYKRDFEATLNDDEKTIYRCYVQQFPECKQYNNLEGYYKNERVILIIHKQAFEEVINQLLETDLVSWSIQTENSIDYQNEIQKRMKKMNSNMRVLY